MDIKNKVAVVTGGASGIGEATVHRYLSLGASVAIFDMSKASGIEPQPEYKDRVRYYSVDVSNEDDVRSAIEETVSRFGGVHICNNFAGIVYGSKLVSKTGVHKLKDFGNVLKINLIGTFNVMRLIAEQMARQEPISGDGDRGVIINTSSIAAFEGQIGQVAYAASKGGVVGMTLPAARDLSEVGIRVNTIVPGLVQTPLFDSLPAPAYEALSKSPLFPKRLALADEVARLCQFIVESDYTNGECIRIDAGLRMQPK